jgi:hypothetical protein
VTATSILVCAIRLAAAGGPAQSKARMQPRHVFLHVVDLQGEISDRRRAQ